MPFNSLPRANRGLVADTKGSTNEEEGRPFVNLRCRTSLATLNDKALHGPARLLYSPAVCAVELSPVTVIDLTVQRLCCRTTQMRA